jgi:hypothetical protein
MRVGRRVVVIITHKGLSVIGIQMFSRTRFPLIVPGDFGPIDSHFLYHSDVQVHLVDQFT